MFDLLADREHLTRIYKITILTRWKMYFKL